MKCQPRCAACCIAPSISSYIPNMPNGKDAGQVCINLENKQCRIFGHHDRPKICMDFSPNQELCGHGEQHAMATLEALEIATKP